jgi:hypothetical protein
MPAGLRICVNLLPIGAYFFGLGLLHISGRAMVTTSVRNYLALALALAGLVITGPIEFLCDSRLIPSILWRLPGFSPVLYLLLVTVFVPRPFETIVVLNVSRDAVTAAMRAAIERTGLPFEEVAVNRIAVDKRLLIEIDVSDALHSAAVQFRGPHVPDLFLLVKREMAAALRAAPSEWSLAGFTLGLASVVILALPIAIIVADPIGLAIEVQEVFRAR